MLIFKPHKRLADGLAFSPDGHLLATSAHHEPVRVWNLDGPTEVQQFPGTYIRPPLAFSPDGRFIGYGGNELLVWEVDSGVCAVADGHGGDVVFSPDSKEVVTVRVDDSLRRWSLPKGKRLPIAWAGSRATNRGTQLPSGGLAYAPDGTNLAIAFGVLNGRRWESRIRIYGRDTGKLLRDIGADFSSAGLSVIAYSPDGTLIAGLSGPVLGVMEVATGKNVAALRPNKKYFKGFRFTPDGKRLLAVQNDTLVRVYDTATWTELAGYEWQIGRLTAVAVAPDGLRAACASASGRVVVWDLEV